jgi:glycosyltransferase involved in cell wall biosynthesis
MDLAGVLPYYVGGLCRSITAEGIDVTVGSATPFRDPSYFPDSWVRRDKLLLDLAGLVQTRVKVVRRILKVFQLIANLLILTGRFAVQRPDIIHVQYLPLVEGGLSLETWFLRYLRMLGSTIVYTVHDLPTTKSTQRKYKHIYRLADAIICHSHSAKNELVAHFGVDSQKIRVIRHGPFYESQPRPDATQARRALSFLPDECILLYQGFIRPYKGVAFLLDAWAKLGTGASPGKLVIAGAGDQSTIEAISRKVAALRVPASVRLEARFLAADEAIAFHAAADILVYPYREVTTSGALMTGLSFGKPLITTALPFFEEVLEGVSSARLVPFGDVLQLAEALTSAIKDWQDGRRSSSMTMAPTNSWTHIARQTCECYRQVLRDSDRARPRTTTASIEHRNASE